MISKLERSRSWNIDLQQSQTGDGQEASDEVDPLEDLTPRQSLGSNMSVGEVCERQADGSYTVVDSESQQSEWFLRRKIRKTYNEIQAPQRHVE